MRKFECNDCEADCELTIQMDEIMPSYCLYDKEKANWHEVVDSAENAQTEQFLNSEQLPSNPRKLPDWFKVGAIGYDNKLNEYFEITNIDNDNVVVKFIETSGYFSYQYFNEFCSEARKRPFNAYEMKALVGKVIEGTSIDFRALIHYYTSADDSVCTIYNSYNAKELMESHIAIDGKPCYVLEHLNEKGEWVE